MHTRRFTMVLLTCGLALGQHVQAGLLDSPAPELGEKKGQVVYRMGPVYYRPGRVDTVITCTNLSDAPASLAIELFDEQDNPVGAVVQAALAAGGKVKFVTSKETSKKDWVALQPLLRLHHGKARVSATTTRISCAAYHRIKGERGVVEEKALELVKKVAR